MKVPLPPAAPLFWDLERNVPLLSKRGDLPIIRVKATPPRDVRLLMGYDRTITEKAIINEFSDSKLLSILLPKDQVILLNKIPYVDAGDEIIVEGFVVGHRFFDIAKKCWRFKPLYEGVSRMIDNRVGYYAIVNLSKLAPRYIVHRSSIIESILPEKKGVFVAVSTKDGEYHAVAKLVRGNRLQLIKVWKGKNPSYIRRSSSISDLIRANKRRLEMLSYKAELIIEDSMEKFKRPVLISFSGGKDSLVVMHIALERLGIDKAIFNDTGIEMPETIKNVEETKVAFNIDIAIASANRAFFASVKKLGPPARDYRWCCKVCKLAPIARFLKQKYPSGNLSIVGQRKYESASRASIPVISRSRWIPNTIVIAPINDWTALDIWMYIFDHKLKANTLYWEGLDRVGCWLCPACELAEFEAVKRLHPELWKPWETFLRSWAEKNNLPLQWVEYGAWRWLKLPGDFKRFLSLQRIDYKRFNIPRASFNVSKIQVNRNRIQVKVEEGVNIYTVKELLKIITREGIKISNKSIIKIDNDRLQALITEDGYISINYSRKEDIVTILKLIARANLCTKCGLCVEWCPSGAIKLKASTLKVDELKCTSCLLCNKACPVATYITPNLDTLKN